MEEVDKKVGEGELKELLENCKIATCFQGHLDAIPTNVQRILDAVDKEKFKDDLPVAIVAVIGPPSSGKSLLTNFLIRCLKAEGAGGWMNQLDEGFAWGKKKNPLFFEPKGETGVSGGVYLWPEPFKMQVRVKVNKGGKEETNGVVTSKMADVIVFVMHMHHVKEEEMPVLERFLSIICSKLVEIKWKNHKLRLLDHLLPLKQIPSAFDECQSAVFVLRSKAKVTDKYEAEAAQELTEMMRDYSNYSQCKDKLQSMNVNLLGLKDPGYELEDDSGKMNQNGYKSITGPAKKVVELTLAEDELTPKKFYGEDLTLKNLVDAICTAAKYTEDRHADCKSLQDDESENLDIAEVSPAAEPEFMTSETPSVTEITLSINNITYFGTRHESVGTEHEAPTPDMSLRQSEVVATPSPPDIGPPSAAQQSQNDSSDSLIVEHGSEKSQASERYRSDSTLSLAPLSNQLSPNSKPFQRQPMEMSQNPCCSTPPPKHLVQSQVSVAELKLLETNLDAVEEAANQLSELSLEANVENHMNHEQSVSETVKKDSFVGAISSNLTDKKDEGLGESAETVRQQTQKKQETREHLNEDISLHPKEFNGNGERLTNSEENQENVERQQSEENKKLPEKEKRLKVTEEVRTRKAEEEEGMRKKAEQEEEKRKRAAEDEGKRKKAEEEEEKRKRAEEEQRIARKQMEDCVNLSFSQINQTLIASSHYFIGNVLNFKTICNICTIYGCVFNSITQNHRHVVRRSLWSEYTRKLDSMCKSKSMEILEPFYSKVLEFNRAVKKKFECYGYHNPKSLEQIIKDEIQKVTRVEYPNAEVNNLITLACWKLGEIYDHHNCQIIEFEKSQYSIAKDKVVNFYREEMRKVMSHAPFNPQKLVAIHEKLRDKLADALKKACHLQSHVDVDVVPMAEILREELNDAFKGYQTTNETKLKKFQMEIRKVVEKYTVEYNKKCEEIFSKYPDGVEVKVLNKLHLDVCIETKKLLEMDIRDKVRKDEPVESYTVLLQTHIDSYWSTVMNVNQKNLRQKAERDEEARRERVKEEARLQLKEREKNNQRSSYLEPKQPSSTTGLVRTFKSTQETSDLWPELPPLVFHLQSTNIVMGMSGSRDVLRNQAEEPRTPAYVVITNKMKVLYGSEAYSQVELTSESDRPAEGCYWSIESLFLHQERNWKKLYSINGEEIEVTHELLLGFIFRKLKETVQQQMKGKCTKTLIAVPFWLSSLQRCWVKDAAKLAGFSEAYLVNEGAAAAYNLALDSSRPTGPFLLLVQNLGRVDVIVYDYLVYDKKIKMLAHKSNYEGNEREWKLGNPFKWACGKAKEYWQGQDGERDKIKANLRDACKNAIKEAPYCSKQTINETVCIHDSDTTWGGLLHELALDFGRPACGIKRETAVITGGIALASNFNEIGTRTCDKFIANLERTNNVGGSATLISKNDSLPQNTRLATTTLGQASDVVEIKLYQNVCGVSNTIGVLKIEYVRLSELLEVQVKITNEGIVTFSEVKSKSSNYNSGVTTYVSKNRYMWKPQNLSPEQYEQQLRLMTALVESGSPKIDPELLHTKERLLQQSSELQEKLTNGMLKIRSKLVKDLVQKKIDEARNFGNHENSTQDKVYAQLAIVKQLFEKYDK